MINKTILMGRLTKTPELKQTQSGKSVCSFTIAVNRRFAKDGEMTADFINCTAWGYVSEFISKYFDKGSMIAIVGRIETRTWEKDGKKNYATEVIVEEAYFTGNKTETTTSQQNNELQNMGFAEFPDDSDLPF